MATLPDAWRCGVRVIGIPVTTCKTPGVVGSESQVFQWPPARHLALWGQSHRYSSGYLADAWRCGVRVTGIPVATCQTPGIVGSKVFQWPPARRLASWGSVTGIPVATLPDTCVVGSVTGIPVATCPTPGVVRSELHLVGWSTCSLL